MTTMDSLFPDPRVDNLVEVLRRTPGWPADDTKDDQFARRLLVDYPSLDLIGLVTKFHGWLEKHPEVLKSAKTNLRQRFVTWVKNEVRYGLQRREQGRGEAAQRRARAGHGNDRARAGASSTAGGREAFGPTGRLDHW